MRIPQTALLAILMGVTWASSCEEAQDPAKWTEPKQRPALKAMPADSPELEERFKAAGKRLEKFEALMAVLPKHGYCINIVHPGSQGDKLGLKKGDVLVK